MMEEFNLKNIPMISIIIPMYNVERYISTCINSILQQTFTDFELIVIDDYSTDRSFEILSQYSDPRIKLRRNIKKLGADSTRNAGISFANAYSKYIYLMDADDALLPDALEVLFNAAEKSQSDVIYMNSYYVTQNPNFSLSEAIDVSVTLMHNPTPRFFSNDLIERLTLESIRSGEDVVTVWIKFMRHDLFFRDGLYFPTVPRGGDLFMDFGVLCLAKKIQVIDSCCYIHRKHHDSLVNLPSKEQLRLANQIISAGILYMEDIFSKKLISPLSRENQIILEAHLIFRFMQFHFINKAQDFSIEDFDLLLKESIRQASSDTPETLRVTLHIICILFKFFWNNDGTQDEIFKLNR